MSDILRDYQAAALEELRGHLRAGLKRLVLVAPTGSGKTTIAAKMVEGAVARSKRVLFVAHRKELIDQAHARISSHGIEAGIIMADHPLKRPDLPVQVASIQTLARRERWPECELIIIDEAHHAAAQSYKRLFDTYPNAWFIGLTATPWRLDGKGLSPTFQQVVVASTPAKLIEQGHLCDYAGFKYQAAKLDGIKTRGGDYDQEELEGAVIDAALLGNVAEEWAAHASAMKTIVFAVSIKHAELLAERFRNVTAEDVETIDHHMNKAEREATLARVRSGETRVIINVGILGEGVDIPDLECAVLARPTKSLALYLQQVGRVMRPAPGKPRARLHDHGRLVERHGLPDQDRDYSLETDRKRQPPVAQLRTCPQCFAVFPPAPVCPECGYVFEVKERRDTSEDGNAVAVDIRAGRKSREAFLLELEQTAIARGYNPGWVVHQHDKRFPGHPKPWGTYRRVRDAQGRSR